MGSPTSTCCVRGLSERRTPLPRAPSKPARLAALDNVRIIGTAGGGQSVADKPRSDHSLRLAELLAAVSLATDLSHDVPAESALRDALLAVELAGLAGWTAADVSDVYYLALLYHMGCTSAVAAQSRLGAGDDVSVRRWMSEADYADRPELVRIAVTKLARTWQGFGCRTATISCARCHGSPCGIRHWAQSRSHIDASVHPTWTK